MFCKHCGKELLDGDLFCMKCGAPVERQNNVHGEVLPTQEISASQWSDNATSSTEVFEETLANRQREIGSNVMETNQVVQPVRYRPAEPEEKYLRILPVIVAVLAVVAIAAIAFFTVPKAVQMQNSPQGASSAQGAEASGGSSNSPDQSQDVAASGKEGNSQGSAANTFDGINIRNSVDEYSWEELSAISKKIAKAGGGQASIELAKTYNLVGSDGKLDGTQTKRVKLADGTEATVQIVGFAHDISAQNEMVGITFAFTGDIAKHAWNSNGKNSGGWRDSDLRSWMNGSLVSMLPEELSSEITIVKKHTTTDGVSQSTASVVETADKLWAPSFVEVVGAVDMASYERAYETVPADQRDMFQGYFSVWNSEGKQYQLYSDMGVAMAKSAAILAKRDAGSNKPTIWWGRSATADNRVLSIDESGRPHKTTSLPDEIYGVVPFFCIGQSTESGGGADSEVAAHDNTPNVGAGQTAADQTSDSGLSAHQETNLENARWFLEYLYGGEKLTESMHKRFLELTDNGSLQSGWFNHRNLSINRLEAVDKNTVEYEFTCEEAKGMNTEEYAAKSFYGTIIFTDESHIDIWMPDGTNRNRLIRS